MDATCRAVVSSDPRLRRDFHRFTTFTQGWVARPGADPDFLGDGRYSSADDRVAPVWGIRFRPRGATVPIEWVDRSGQRRVDPAALWREVAGRDPHHRLVP